MQNIKDLAASSAKTWGEIAQAIDDNFKGTTDVQKNDLNYVRALDANGNPILISKADLASVVGDIINVPYAKITIRVLNSGFLYIMTGYKNHQLGTSTVLLSGYKDGIEANFLNKGNKIKTLAYTKTETSAIDVTLELYVGIDAYSDLSMTPLAISNDTYIVSIEEYNGEIPSDAVEVSLE